MEEDFDLDDFVLEPVPEEEDVLLDDEEESVTEDATTEDVINDMYKGEDIEVDESVFRNAYEKQKSVELVMARNHAKSRIMDYLFNYEKLNDRIHKHFDPVEDKEDVMFIYEFLYQLILRKRIDILTIVGIMRKRTNEATETISKCVKALSMGLCKYDAVRQQFVVGMQLPEELQKDIDRFGYPLPMIIKPKKLTHNKQTGYVTLKGSLVLKNNHTDEDINLDHLNRINRIPLTINEDVYHNTELIWSNMEKPKSYAKLGEYNKKMKAFNKFKKDSEALILMMCKLSPIFYLTHKYDKRGRIYCQGYHFNYQSSDWNKAIIHFAEEEIVEID